MSDAAIANIVTGVVTIATIVVGFLTVWVKIKYGRDESKREVCEVQKKIDDNTRITEASAIASTRSAKVAAITAQEAKIAAQTMSDTLDKKLNGGLDKALSEATAPIHERLVDHEDKIAELVKYQYETKHELVNAINAMNLKLDIAIKKIDGKVL